jgi:hypothetical protein
MRPELPPSLVGGQSRVLRAIGRRRTRAAIRGFAGSLRGENMKHQAHAPVAKPMDFYTVMGMEAPDFGSVEKACRAWFDGAQMMQEEAAEFVNTRAGKDMAALSEWTRCATATDALEVQARYASEALADYVAGSQRMWRLMAAAGQPVGEARK